MASTVVKLNLFIASPDDVSAERAVVRDICESLCKDEIIKGHNLMIEAVGWEEVFPQPGRPQEIINRLVDVCDIFVCIFYRRFGTPTGVADSGTHEEFLLALDHWKNLKKPQIFFYFKDVQIRSSKDFEDDQLKKVFKLKEQIENEHTLIYSTFQDTDQFREKILSDLKKWIADTKPWEIVPSTKKVPVIPDSPGQYLKWVADRFGYVEAEKLQAKGNAIPLKLPEIFIPLYTYDFESEKIKKAEEYHPQVLMDDLYEIIDIETLISQYDYLLIEGQAGSGKTTVLKHFAYILTGENGEFGKPDGMEGYIPILIFLKDLNLYFDNSGNLDVHDIITWYLKKSGGDILNTDTVYEYFKTGKIVLLLDGLDELKNEYRDIVVNLFADLRFKHKGVKIVLSSRPHGIEGAAINRFGDRHAKLLALDMEQISLFINKWFSYIYSGSTVISRKNAETMIIEIKSHPAISDLVNNPLILTAVCILYYNNKELPGQRAELYQKLIENLLHRRFQETILVHEFLKKLAFKMHESGVRSVDKNYAIDVLKGIIKRIPGENDLEYRTRLEKEFSYIEPRCGLLLFENGQYMFWHLSFQEFLTAHHLVSNRSDYIEAIYNYWDDDWYKEVIELFIGFLGVENTKTANDIIFHALNGNDSGDFKKWRLASKSFLSLEKGKRTESTEQKSREKMIEILDKSLNPKVLADAGELLGWTGDPRDLKEFVCIEGGIYDLEGFGKTEITTFDIGKYPVTNGWYEEFIIDGGYGNERFWSKEGLIYLKTASYSDPRFWKDKKWNCPNLPVVGVSWYEAYAFCKWLTENKNDGKEYLLPNELQWQAAAAGKTMRKYPWGKGIDKYKCNYNESEIEGTSTVGIFQIGKTPEGVYDMGGNVFEWMSSDYDSKKVYNDYQFEIDIQHTKKNPVLRGGAYYRSSDYCHCSFRGKGVSTERYSRAGFRCIRRPKLMRKGGLC